jgi:hypothetical protein
MTVTIERSAPAVYGREGEDIIFYNNCMKTSSIILVGFILITTLLSSCNFKEDKTLSYDIPKSEMNTSVEEKSINNNISIDSSWTWYVKSSITKIYTGIPVASYGTSCILSNPKTPVLTMTGIYSEMYQEKTYPIFAKDTQYAYFNYDEFKSNFQIINKADVQSFSIGDNELGLWEKYATDKDSLYFMDREGWCVKMQPFSRDTFTKKVFQNWELFSKDQDNVYFLMVECGDGCSLTTFHKIEGADPKSFEVLSNDWKYGAYSKDAKYVYRSLVTETWSYTNILEWVNPKEFTLSSIQ